MMNVLSGITPGQDRGIHRYDLTGTTNASGAVTVEVGTKKYPQLLYAVEWVDGDLANEVDAVLSCIDTASGIDTTLLTLTDADDDAWYYPREAEDSNVGVALTTYTLNVVQGKLQLVIASGGDTKTGGAWVYTVEV